ncbi:MAG TPA: S8 family peptidase [Anaeromyxobacteraceae bacterium]|nr:S8 family peptidase [Anaeromyxobacteraceae bacterium]
MHSAVTRAALLVWLLPAQAALAEGRSDLALAALAVAQHVPGEVLVQFRAGASEEAREAAVGRVRGARYEKVVPESWRWDGRGDLELVLLPAGVTVAQAVRALEPDPAVSFAEPNWVYQHGATSNDPYYTNGSLWGMYGDATSPANAFGSQAGEAWARGSVGSSTVLVGVIDEGIMYSHADLAGQVWTNPFDPVDGVDNDGNGYVDDVHGWDFDGNDATTYDGTQDDHGTHVAGTIAARGGNGIGVAGVSWNVTLVSAKFLGRRGGTTANAVRAVDYLTDLKIRHGLDVVATNNSWGGGGFSQALLDAIDRGGDAGILFVAAAGNGGADGVGDDNDTTPHYPSSYQCTRGGTRGWDCIVAVASITSTGAKSGFSNYGDVSVDLGAPGSGIVSTLPGRADTSAYGSYSGTSMATPHVTGGAALYAASHPTASAQDIRAAILSSTVPTSSLQGLTVTGGRLDASGF